MARPSTPATPAQHTAARTAVAMRVGLLLVGAPMAALAAVRPVDLRWLAAVIAGYGLWVALFTWVGLTRGLVAPLVAGDVALTVAVCLLNSRIVPVDRVEDGSGWVATIGSLCVITVPLAWRARAAIPAGLAVVVAFGVSFPLGDRPGRGLTQTAVMAAQLLGAAAVMGLVRRTSRGADVAVTDDHEARRQRTIAEARRADESAQLRLLHDTALTTLTLVGTGAIERSETLSARAAADLAAIERLAARDRTDARGLVRLDELLAEVAGHAPGALRVTQSLLPCLVPAVVGEAFARGAAEALLNIERHAGTGEAVLRLTAAVGQVRVEVSDAGRGFDLDKAAAHRYGIRQSIVGRMAAAGGHATVTSGPGQGTQWTLDWSTVEGAA